MSTSSHRKLFVICHFHGQKNNKNNLTNKIDSTTVIITRTIPNVHKNEKTERDKNLSKNVQSTWSVNESYNTKTYIYICLRYPTYPLSEYKRNVKIIAI